MDDATLGGSTPIGATGRAAHAAARHPWITIVVWGAIVALAMATAAAWLDSALTDDGDLLIETESDRAAQLIQAAARDVADDEPVEWIVVTATSAQPSAAVVGDPAFDTALRDLADAVSDVPGVAAVASPLDGVPGLVSADNRFALLQATLGQPTDETIADLVATVADYEPDGFRVVAVGDGSANLEFERLAEDTLVRGELLGLSAALVILVLVFGAVVAALVPLTLAVISVTVAIGLTAIVGQFMDLSLFVVNMITMIGLAVGIDYSLFAVQRYREERRAGHGKVDAIALAGSTATRAVVFSGITVVIALLGLMLMPDTTMRSLGIGAILVVLVAVAAATTLLPAFLSLLGDGVDRLHIGRRRPDREGRTWARISHAVMARPLINAAVAAGLLLLLAAPAAWMQLGSTSIDALPEDSDTRFGFEVLNTEFSGGLVTTPVAVTAADVSDPAVTAAVDQLVAALDADADYADVAVTPVPGDDLVIVEATTLLDPSTLEARAAVDKLRTETIPAAFDGTGAEALVAGEAAGIADYVSVMTGRAPLIVAVVLAMSFVLLLLAFRSVVVPAKAIVMNLLSVGATYGLVVAVFQRGWGADLLGFQTSDVIEAWVPLFLFTVLFGLSMDYHVFLLSRIKERYDVTRDNAGSVAFGLAATGRIITGAALIMVAVFGGFATGDLAMFQQMGFGLGVAVILDATIVRSVLVPASMALLGDRNWYFPRWLAWLPEIHVEGHVPAPTTAAAADPAVPVVSR